MLKEKFETIPEKIRLAIRELSAGFKQEGYECYLVGGSCRDLLLDEIPKDFDFATNCPLKVTKKIFPRVIATGESHGTLSIIIKGILFEVTRYRKDVQTDGRRAVIAYSDSIEEDQKRRDLRINTIAYDILEDNVVDSQGGLSDFKNRLIRFVGKASQRVLEDHLRAIRYIRLTSRLFPLGFKYDDKEMDEVISVFDCHRLSLERIYEEMHKIFANPNRDKIFLKEYLCRLNFFDHYFDDSDIAKKVIADIVEKDTVFPFFYAYQKNHSIKDTTIDLKLSKKQKKILLSLVRFQSKDLQDVSILKKLISKTDSDDMFDTIKIFEKILGINLSDKIELILKSNDPIFLKDISITGGELQKLGVTGRNIGIMLEYLQHKVWENPSLNTLRQLKTEVKNRFKI
ncbi:MAG: CCA tRNA nucleotidyltransferase [Deltaproteobacteria bacterium]|nr:CCA tRNA nucleotidyltransferase [Deltaproteobacteria bacterium]